MNVTFNKNYYNDTKPVLMNNNVTVGIKPFLMSQEINQIIIVVITMTGLVTNLLTIYLLISVSANERCGKSTMLSSNRNSTSKNVNKKPNTNQNQSHQYSSNYLNHNSSNHLNKKSDPHHVHYSRRHRLVGPHHHHHHSFSSSHLYMLALAISDTFFLVAHLFEDTIPSFASLELIHWVNRSSFWCKLALYVRNTARVCSSYLIVFFAYERFTAVKKPLNRLNYDSKRLTKIIIASIFVTFTLLNLYTPVVNGLRPKIKSVLECDVEIEYKSIYVYIMVPYVSIAIFLPLLFICYFNISITRMLSKRKHRMFHDLTTTTSNNSTQSHSVATSTAARRNSNTTKAKQPPTTAVVVNEADLKAKMTIRVKMLEIRVEQMGANKSQQTSNSDEIKCQSEQPKSRSKLSSPSFSIIRGHGLRKSSNLANNLKGADRATVILLLISACFVLLNLPYVIAWANFIRFEFEPKKSGGESTSATLHPYSYIPLAKIFHIVNFSINFFLYCLASRRFRSHLMKSFGCEWMQNKREPIPL